MAEIILTQSEADALIAMEKHCVENNSWNFPSFGGKICVPLVSSDNKESFLLDIYRSRIDLKKGTFQNRGRQVVVLVRLDIGGHPHRNPDGEEIGCPHLHLYKEGYGDKWAQPVPANVFANIDDQWKSLYDFMEYCNVKKVPDINKELFT